jgi:hypothetical protein
LKKTNDNVQKVKSQIFRTCLVASQTFPTPHHNLW